ncbi:unnamed protein product [Adineta ricciae]|uniref:BED-type domain-containing protein n=1 Tax=Adineta ricciae TaxID=249248 RepID=A0A815SUQ9_ADIRI|nr:unnamed protein product [Adineta ricciae]CAF1494712.1 unnamed protein product [Adineta ricciae]
MESHSDKSFDNPEVSILLLPLTPTSQSQISSDLSSQNLNLPDPAKNIRSQFYSDIKTYDTNWCATCLLCKKVQFDKKGVTSNTNRHVKSQHKKEYEKWVSQLNESNKNNQVKISDALSKNSDCTKKRQNSKPVYHDAHPRQTQLSEAISMNLIIELGLPLSLVERPAFIDFMYTVDPKFTITSRRTLSRSVIPQLFNTELGRKYLYLYFLYFFK